MLVNLSTVKSEVYAKNGDIWYDKQNKVFKAKAGDSIFVINASSDVVDGLILGETDTTAYRGDRGKAAYAHSQQTGNPHSTTKSDIGLGNVDNTADIDKPISTLAANAIATKVDGTGTQNYLARFSQNKTIENSIVYDTGTNVGIDKTAPSEKLDINGRAKSDGQVFNETTTALIPRELKFKDGKFKAALADSVEKSVLLEGDVQNNILRNFQSNNINYCGYAPFGSAESASVWTVTKITVAANGTITKETFTNVTWSSVPF